MDERPSISYWSVYAKLQHILGDLSTFAYAGVLGIGIPAHVSLMRRGRIEYRYYAICGSAAATVIGVILGVLIELISTEVSFLTPLVYCLTRGWLVSSAFWLLVGYRDAVQDSI